MTRRQKLLLFVLNKLYGTCDWMGNLIVFAWLLQAITGFEWHPTYWFAGVNTWYGAFGFWMLAWLIYIFEMHFKRKYKE